MSMKSGSRPAHRIIPLPRNAGSVGAGTLSVIATAAVVSVALDALTVGVTCRLSALVTIIDAISGVTHAHSFTGAGLAHAAALIAELTVQDVVLNAATIEVTASDGTLVAIARAGSGKADRAQGNAATSAIALPGLPSAETTATYVFLDALTVGITSAKGALIVVIRTLAGLAALVQLTDTSVAGAFAAFTPGTVGHRDPHAGAAWAAGTYHTTIGFRWAGLEVTDRTVGLADPGIAHAVTVVARAPVGLIEVDALPV